jgi:hypothetical protein
MQIGETIGLDPTWNVTGTINGNNVDFNISTLNNASVNSGDISGTALTSSQITSLQSALNSGTTTWSQPYTAGAIWDTSNLTYSVASGYNTSSNPIRINTASSSGGELLSVNSGNNGSVIVSADQNRNGGSAGGTFIIDKTTNEYFTIMYPRSADTHTKSLGGNSSWHLAYHSNCNYNDPHKVVISGSAVTAYCGSTVARSGGVAVSSNFQAMVSTWGSNDGYNYWDVTATGDFAASTPTLNVNYTLLPSIPTDVSATQNTTTNYNTVDLTWSEGTNGSQSTSYEVFRGGSSIGTVNQTTLNSDHSDDFSTDNWSDTGFTGVSGGVLTGDLNRGTTNHGSILSLGSAVDNSQWVMRFQLDINTKATAENNSVALYLSDSGLVGINSNKDGLGLGLSQYWDSFALLAPDNTYSFYNTSYFGTPNTGTYYIEIIRTSSTTADMNIYSDSSYSTLLHSTTNHTISSGIQNLDTVVVQGMNDNGSGGTWNISIDNLEIWDGVITPSSLDTNFTDSNAPHSSNLSYTVSGTNTVGTSSQSSAGLIETFYVPNQVVNVTDQGASSPLILDWDVPTVPSVTNTVSAYHTPITWNSNTVDDFTINGNTATPTHTSNGWNNSIQSTQTWSPSTGGGEVEWTVTGDRVMAGFAKDPYPANNVTNSFSYIDFGLYADNNTWGLQPYESGNQYYIPSPPHTWNVGDTFKTTMDSNGTVKYYHNGTLFYTSTITAGQNDTYYFLAVSYQTASLTTTYLIPSSTVTTPSPSLSGYQIERDDGSGFNVIQANHGTNQYSDGTASGNVVYKISGINAVGTGTASANHNALAGVPPNAPVISTAINDPNSAPLDITVSISPDSVVGTGTLTGFEIYRDGALITTTGLVSTYVDTVPNEGTFEYSAKSVSTHGTSVLSNLSSITTPSVPDAPATVNTSINNPNSNPFDITIGWSASPNDQGSAITNYKVYRSSDNITYTSIATLGNSVLSYADTVTGSGGYYYKISSVNNVGEGLQSSYSLINTPTVPDAPVLSSNAINSTQIDSTWNTPSNGNSEILSYEISVDGTVTNVGLVNTNSQTGLTQNTSYEIKIRAVNNVGTSAWSNIQTITTHTPPSGTNSLVLNNSWGDVVIVDNTITMSGNPTPTLDKIEFVLDGNIVGTINNPSLTGTYALTLPDTNQHGLLVAATMNNSETTAINSNSLLVTGVTVNRIGAAEGTGTVAYTINRTEHPTNSALDEIELKWARDSFPFNGSCTFMSPSQAMNVRDLNDLPSNLVYHTQSSVNVFDTTVDISEKNNAYIYCWSDTELMFGAQSEALGSNALLSGLSGLDSALGTTTVDPNTGEETSYSILGAPMIVIFVLLIAGQATGRTAPTFIIILLAAVGILMGLGFFIIDEGIFGLMLIMGALGVMIGKKFL